MEYSFALESDIPLDSKLLAGPKIISIMAFRESMVERDNGDPTSELRRRNIYDSFKCGLHLTCEASIHLT